MARRTVTLLGRPENRTRDPERTTQAAPFLLLGAMQVVLIATITIITVALPAIQRDLHADSPGLVLISSGYGISFGGLLLLGGRLADSFGYRRVFAAGLVVFTAASAAAGLALSAGMLVLARFAEGGGAALVAPSAMAMLRVVVPDPVRQRRAVAVWGVLSSTGAIAGAVLSGVLLTWMSWRWMLALPAAMAAAALVAAPRVLPGRDSSGAALARRRADWPGAILATGGLAIGIYGLQRSGWAVLASAVLLAAFCLTERHSDDPLLPLAFARRRLVPLTAVAACAATMASAFFLLSLYLQQVRGLSPLRASAVFVLAGLPTVASAAVAPRLLTGRLIPRFGTRPILAAGLLTAAAGLSLLSMLSLPYPGLLVFPLGAGLAFSAATVDAVRDVGERQSGLAAGLVNTAMETGPPLGLAVLARIAAAYSHHPAAGYPFALRIAAVPLAVAAVFTMMSRHPPRGARRKTQ